MGSCAISNLNSETINLIEKTIIRSQRNRTGPMRLGCGNRMCSQMYLASLHQRNLFSGYQLYPHGFDDFVFIIYQPEIDEFESRRSSITP